MSMTTITRRFLIISFVFLALTLLSACGSGTVEYSSTPIERTPLNLPDPPALSLHEIEWVLVTEENVREVLNEISNNGEKRILFALSQDDFERMTENLQEMANVIILYRETLGEYRVYYNESPDRG